VTSKTGFSWGLIAGFVGWLFFSGALTFIPAPMLMRVLVAVLAFTMFIFSVAITIASTARGKAVFDTTTDGFIYGFTVAFDILYIITQLSLGNLPLP
jgi:hypothetical protein